MEIFEIPRKLKVTWDPKVKAIIITWLSYIISDEEFKTAVLTKGLNYAKTNNANAWIVDASKARGLFKQSQIDIIDNEIFPAFAKNGIKYFITIKPETSIFTEQTVKKFSALTGPHGLKLIETANINQAIMWLRNQQ